jgi:hypothetical protein
VHSAALRENKHAKVVYNYKPQNVYVCKFGRKVTNNLANMQLLMQKKLFADRISAAREGFMDRNTLRIFLKSSLKARFAAHLTRVKFCVISQLFA